MSNKRAELLKSAVRLVRTLQAHAADLDLEPEEREDDFEDAAVAWALREAAKLITSEIIEQN